MKSEKKLIAIVGPTAVGKTALAIDLAERLKTEIISADSRQIFKELRIGTAKPSDEELARVQHHFVNTKSITDEYNAGQFGAEAFDLTVELFTKFDHLILCGGSGLYVKALLEGFDEMPDIPIGVRDVIIKDYDKKGLRWLQQEVERADPDYYSKMDINNPHRLIRALELNRASGKSVESFRKKNKKELPFEVVKIGLELPREKLFRKIDERMDRMIEQGLFEEAEKFYPQRQLNALQTVGYQEIFGFMNGLYDRQEAIRLLKRNSRRYAKRQLTWFARDKEISWFGSPEAVWDFLVSGK